MDKKIILASSSPRRKEILEKMGLEFEIIQSDYEELLENLNFSYEKIEELAYNKANSVLQLIKPICENFIILSADTVVVLENKILGKPKTKIEAVETLKQLSDRKHSVVTSVCVLSSKDKQIHSETSYVEFEKLDEKSILYYVETFNPLDKAGSYGIQELPEGFVKNIEGSFENIIGLCSKVVGKLINDVRI